jgi:hypothetical protein
MEMQSRTKKQSFMGTWSGSIAVACLALMLGFASTGYGDVILGNFESADSNDGWGGGSNDPNAILVPDSNIGVTLGHGSLKLKSVSGGYWGLAWQGSPLDLTDANFQFDLTMVASEWGGGTWTQVGTKIAINSNGHSGWKEFGPDVPDNNVTVIDRDTGIPTDFWWGAWVGDANKTYTANVSNYDATGATWMQVAISVQDGNVLDTGHFYFDNMRLITPAMKVSKCKVTAGKTQASSDTDYSNMTDAFTASGTVVLPTDVNDIDSVVVTVTSTTDGEVIYTETLSDFNPTVVNSKHKYTHTGKIVKGQKGKITSLTLDFRKGTFAIAAKNIDLTGLACPFEVKFTMGSYELKGNAYEAVVNGTKTIPTRLMRMYKDTLIVTKATVKNSTSALSDSLSVSGEIAVEDIAGSNLASQDVNVIWGAQTFTIPSSSFAAKTGHSYKCSKVPVDSNGLVTATIDLDKCTFAVSIAKANINAVSGDVVFGLRFADFNETDNVNLP